jgi:acyl dehydratase
MKKINVGTSFHYDFQLSARDVSDFIQLSGDNNIIHTDQKAATSSPIGSLCVPGMLPALMFSRVLGTLFPGHGTIYRYQNLKFPKPIFVERKYVVLIKVKRIIPETHTAIVQTEIRDKADNTLCITGDAKVMHLTLL